MDVKWIVSLLRNMRQTKVLAIRAEALARDLNKLPASSPESTQDLVAILQSTCTLLERLTEQQATLLAPSPAKDKQDSSQPPVAQNKQAATASPSISNKDATLSTTAKELIKLSDWVLLAKAGGTSVQPQVLEEIYRRLTHALETEGVMLLNAEGPCDYERQMIVGTESTDDPTRNDYVHSTVRPGYLFHDQLIRPQEVIVYTS
ncbi:nucleotide exchange factor GrpE [Dictyobacter formicarum]|uniref:Nucleotide exchange factor GrpE n=1 Tax=Dictyobacter formicarum TaxID=2778368 RepID=A0ABQ3V7Y3_9CHLR|nr:nucleotide exchange factor GrpE [Dictyobacter formicarum]GHO82247.1 hypothetical protein KSZ_02530 [Dictyobacter formicarum]